MAVQYTAAALLDLDAIEIRLAGYSTNLAERVFAELEDTFQLLAQMPFIGRARNELEQGVRSLVYKRGCTIFYSLIDDGILIERVATPRQDTGGMFGER